VTNNGPGGGTIRINAGGPIGRYDTRRHQDTLAGALIPDWRTGSTHGCCQWTSVPNRHPKRQRGAIHELHDTSGHQDRTVRSTQRIEMLGRLNVRM